MPKTGPEFTPWEIKMKNEEKKKEQIESNISQKNSNLYLKLPLFWFKIIFKSDQGFNQELQIGFDRLKMFSIIFFL